VVSDHHVPEPTASSAMRKGQALLTDFSSVVHINPHMHGISGANELSGAGATFLVAVAMDPGNVNLAHLAVLGAVGDLQDQKTRRLEGLNRAVLEVAKAEGLVEALNDIRYFGRETRPVHKMLEFSSDPFLPRITGNEEGALGFLLELGIELKDGDSWRTWSDLTDSEKGNIITALQDYLISIRRRPETIDRLSGEVYVFLKEGRKTPVRDAKEFATLLNACGRHGRAELGLKICCGDRGDALEESMALLRDHRSALSRALNWAKGSGIIRMRNIQFFDAGDEIEDTIVGTVAGMLLGTEGADRSAPMVAFAESTEYADTPKMKASARGTQELVARGMDLSAAMRTSAEKVGGVGGGHNIAAGATIPSEKRDEFLALLDDVVGSQLISRARRPR
ncbi:MAG: DHH family phosphoesterase, partial [Candidatus Thermoplasmatota archaeon]|nr:DHH family phosphoesterase [Candidatus Thermoplasmatota archaeon]